MCWWMLASGASSTKLIALRERNAISSCAAYPSIPPAKGPISSLSGAAAATGALRVGPAPPKHGGHASFLPEPGRPEGEDSGGTNARAGIVSTDRPWGAYCGCCRRSHYTTIRPVGERRPQMPGRPASSICAAPATERDASAARRTGTGHRPTPGTKWSGDRSLQNRGPRCPFGRARGAAVPDKTSAKPLITVSRRIRLLRFRFAMAGCAAVTWGSSHCEPKTL